MRRTKREIIAAEASDDEDMLTAKSILLRRQREEYAKFSKEAGLLTQNERTQVYGFGKSVAQKARWKAQANLAKNIDLFDIDDTFVSKINITANEIIEELTKSPIGRETIEYIKSTKIVPRLNYAPRFDGARGDQLGDEIRIFMRNINSPRVAAQTVIHEITHHKYGIEKSQWAEAVCMAKEKMHIVGRNYLTIAEKRYIVKLAKKHYTNYNWRKGGKTNGKYSKNHK